MTHPFRDVAIVAAHNTEQAKALSGHDSISITLAAAIGVSAAAGVDLEDVDGVLGSNANHVVYALGMGPVHTGAGGGISAVLHAAALIASRVCTTVLVADGGAGAYTDHASTAPWTRPGYEFVASPGLYTAVEFALVARRHMELFGTTEQQLATVAATIRNNGHVNPEAVFFGRGPYAPDDVLRSRMVADPFHLLDCSINAEGGCAVLLTTADRAAQLPLAPVYVLGGALDYLGPAYRHPPSWDLRGSGDVPNGLVGRRAAQRAFTMSGLGPGDVDVCELYDPFSFEIIRQLEAYGFCDVGEGGRFVDDGNIAPTGTLPVTTDGGTLSFSHGGGVVQMLQRVVRGVQQLQRACSGVQVAGAEVALCSNGGAGALFNEVLLLGAQRP